MAIVDNTMANAQSPSPKEGLDAAPKAVNSAAHQDDAFHGLSHMVAGLTTLDEPGRVWLENKNNSDRTIDLTRFTALAHTARLHLTENGSLLFSYQMDGNVYNHQMTQSERAKLNEILTTDSKMPKDIQGSEISQLFSKITVDQSIQNNFEENMARNINNLNLNGALHR